jgi:hypothetical protein
MDSNGSPMPARDVLQFANSRVKDDASNNKTIVAPAHGHTNLLNPTLGTTTVNGVTCTANGDGTYTLNGSTTIGGLFPLATNIDTLELPKTYRLVGCPSGGTGSTFELNTVKIKDGVRTVYASDYGNGATKEYESGAKYEIRIRMAENTTFNNVTFKPMLTTDLSVTYDDFVQYSGDGELNENVAELYEGLESTDANLADVQSQIVTSGNIESGNTATSAHTVGTYIQWKGKFYVVTSAIAVGDTLAVGTNLAAKTVGDVLTQINADLSINTEKILSLTTSQYESYASNFTPNKTGIYLVKLYYHNDEPLELRVGTTSDYRNSEYIVNQPAGNLGALNLICFLNAGVTYSIGTKYAYGGFIDNNAGYIQRLITVS